MLRVEQRPLFGAHLACLRNHRDVCDTSTRKTGVHVVTDEAQKLVGDGGWQTSQAGEQWFSEYIVLTLQILKQMPGPNPRIRFNWSGLKPDAIFRRHCQDKCSV